MTSDLISSQDWKAWHDIMPGKPPTLYIEGKCTFPTSGYSASLKPRVPQGINPKYYLMDLVEHRPTGPVSEVLTTVEVKYFEKTNQRYDSVSIDPGGISIPVQEVS
jgi:hypothetical protein